MDKRKKIYELVEWERKGQWMDELWVVTRKSWADMEYGRSAKGEDGGMLEERCVGCGGF